MKQRQSRGGRRGELGVAVCSQEVAQEQWSRWQERGKRGGRRELLPPSMATFSLLIRPLHLASPSSFWVVHPEVSGEEVASMEGMVDAAMARCPRVAEEVEVKRGELYLAPLPGTGRYHRVVVDRVEGGSATLFYIDQGATARVRVAELLAIPGTVAAEAPGLVGEPGQALEVWLCRGMLGVARVPRRAWLRRAAARANSAEPSDHCKIVGVWISPSVKYP